MAYRVAISPNSCQNRPCRAYDVCKHARVQDTNRQPPEVQRPINSTKSSNKKPPLIFSLYSPRIHVCSGKNSRKTRYICILSREGRIYLIQVSRGVIKILGYSKKNSPHVSGKNTILSSSSSSIIYLSLSSPFFFTLEHQPGAESENNNTSTKM